MSLPLSIYATPASRAFGDAGRMPADHPKLANLQVAYVARTPSMANVRTPCFGYLTIKNRNKHGGEPERAPFLTFNILAVPGGGKGYLGEGGGREVVKVCRVV